MADAPSTRAEATPPKGSGVEASAFTLKSVLVGCVGAFSVSAGAAYGTLYLHGSFMALGTSMPGAVFILFVLGLLINPLLKFVHPSAGLNRRELLVVYIMMVMASPIPTLFVGKFLSALSYPFYYATAENEWYELIHPYLPEWMMVHDLEAARKLLAQAGYPGGRGLRSIEILFNTSEGHRKVAEAIQQDWQRLGVDVRLRNLEWQTHLATTRKMEYDVARAGWTGDYPDPNTFLDLFVTDGVQNETGWGNADFDRLIDRATREPDAAKRMQILHEAEEILMGELPVFPIYFYVSTNLVKPYVQGFFSNSQDLHPLPSISIDPRQKKQLAK